MIIHKLIATHCHGHAVLNSWQVFDLQTGNQADELVVAEGDTVNGCHAHPFLNLMAVSTGAINA
jgi:hypothetical protein